MSKVSECLWVLLAHNHVFSLPFAFFLFFCAFCSGEGEWREGQSLTGSLPLGFEKKTWLCHNIFSKRDPFKRLLLCLFNLARLCFCLVQQERQGMTDAPMNQTGHLERFYHSHKYITAAVDAFSTQRELQSRGCQLKWPKMEREINNGKNYSL